MKLLFLLGLIELLYSLTGNRAIQQNPYLW